MCVVVFFCHSCSGTCYKFFKLINKPIDLLAQPSKVGLQELGAKPLEYQDDASSLQNLSTGSTQLSDSKKALRHISLLEIGRLSRPSPKSQVYFNSTGIVWHCLALQSQFARSTVVNEENARSESLHMQ